MKNNRQKIGDPGINWVEAALGIGKNRRKTIGFGQYSKKTKEYEDEFYIREMSIIDAGIGCALWDAAIILTRYIYEFGDEIFANRKVMELGAGVALCGICASRFASKCYITDLPHLVDNMEYNLKTNSYFDETDENTKCKSEKIKKYKQQMQQSGKVMELDWYKIYDEIPKALQQIANGEQPCMEVPEKCEIIIGSELTYTGDEQTIEALMKVIDTFLDEKGVFLEILSDDRDGVSYFVDQITKPERYNYILKSFKVHSRYMGNFGTGQRDETYKFYVLTRKENEEGELFLKMCETMKNDL
ncbi:hypothetical protein FDP41_000572 [Naegleria fowleri]|uniref:Methyltransferase small domain-containing protein n=1 Tax=Naegleria fowleri TaxID=5763 RepID=A0A6A5C2L8_NAEFO|nr:uncharacterized protein FDP41_000572 [Naegleria fowleri]KAF0984673.1 hypothetical protein FDP41_000572 [Naegleria fowleri]CAG4708625.1 unnamed protein product [Naegleria fowleri]